ncbi:MAG: hydantoinase/oxoprolinase family protein [Casimicrobiaceae bacterium]
MSHRIGVDIGGTFTDIALFDDATGEVSTHKQLTTPADPSVAVMEGIGTIVERAGLTLQAVDVVAHGTTLVTNAIIERKGVPTAMLVNRGFRDVLDIALERRYDLFDLRLRFPQPVVPRNLRIEVTGRLLQDGTEEIPLDLDGALPALRSAVEDHGVQSIAVCFLHSYVDPRHEIAAVEWLGRHFSGLHVSASADVFPYIREYERWTTACLNAYVQPVVDRYLTRLETGLAALGFEGRFLIMSSSGGSLTADIARRLPVRLLESGPAAGALMSAAHGRALNETRVLSFDMGGTTAKGCLIRDGEPLKRYELEVARVHEFKKGSGLPAKIPVIDMIEIGAGGGSLAEIDERGTLRVGPRSAGANPGPVCYGQGGTLPTLTDANLLLGYLDSASFLGGEMALDARGAREAMNERVAQPLGVSALRAAWGIHEVINEDVARAFRVHASERGADFRNCSMTVFGGSGPLHGSRVARKLRIPRVICPWGAGVMSAFGLLASPLGFEIARSKRIGLARLSPAELNGELASLGQQASQFLAGAGIPPSDIRLRHALDMRYEGQGYEVEVPLPSHLAPDELGVALPALFAERYRVIFGLDFPERAIEIVNWKVEAAGPRPGTDVDYHLKPGAATGEALKGRRPAFFPETDGLVDCPVYDRYALPQGFAIAGPALVEERESTCVIAPGDTGTIDAAMNLVLTVGSTQ